MRLPENYPVSSRFRGNGGRHKTLSLLQGEGRFEPFQWLGGQKRPPVHRVEKKGLTATGIAAVLHCVPSWLRAGRRQKAEMAENRGCRGKIAKKT